MYQLFIEIIHNRNMGVIGNSIKSVKDFYENSIYGDLHNRIADGAGELTGTLLSELTAVLPGKLGEAFSTGLAQSGLGEIFGDAFQNIFLASKFQAVIDILKQTGEVVSKSWEKADQAAFNYGKQIGLTSQQVRAFRNDILDLSEASGKFGINYGKTLEDIIKLQSSFSSELGRNIRMTNSQIKDIAALSAVVGDDMAVKFSAQLENFGLSTTQAGEMMTQMFNKSVKQGLSLEAYSKNVSDNLQIAQQFTFKRGVEGLAAMAEHATKMKLDMQQTINLANKLAEGGIESAVNMSAELQVLGGPFAQFADPMALLHGSLMDMEDLSERLTSLVGQIGFFNKNTGQIDIGAFDRQRLRAASSAMGLDYGKLIESATQQAKRKEVENQMQGLGNIPDEYKELIMNTAQFQNGVAGVRGADGEFKNLRSLNGADLRKLADFAKTDSENIRDIAIMLRGMTDIKEGTEKEKENERATMYRQQSEAIKGIYQAVGESKDALQQLVKIELATTIAKTAQPYAEKAFGIGVDFIKGLISKKEKGGIIKTHSEGDLITNGTPGREYILNSAQHGEFIVNKQATKHHLELLRAINADKNGNLRIKRHEEGGMIDNLLMASMMMSGGKDVDVQKMISQGVHNARYNKIMSNLEVSASQMKESATQQSLRLNRMGGYYDSAILQEQRFNQTYGIKGRGRMEIEYNNLVEERNKTLRRSNQLNNKALQERYANFKMAQQNRVMGNIANGSMAVLAGVGAGISSWQGYKADGTNIMNKGKAVGGTVGATIGATAGAALGSIAGPLGTMIGAAAGQAIGKFAGEAIGKGSQTRRSNKHTEFGAQIDNGRASNAFMGIQGDFSTKELRQIRDGIKDGKLREYDLDKDLVEKMKRSGNSELFTKTFARGGLLKGKSHAEGGIILNEAEGGEFIVNKNATAKSMGILNKINNGNVNDSNIKSVEPMGKQMKVKETYSNNNPSNQTVRMEPINININGTIKLDTGDKTFDISKELFNNPTLINKLTDIITKQINIDENGTFSRKDYRRRYSSV